MCANIEDPLRSFWLPGLNAVSGKVFKGVAGWISDEEYQIYTPPRQDVFALTVLTPEKLLTAIAADLSRCAIASFESLNNIAPTSRLPRSTAWLVIKSYYGAFFAAHAIARTLGFGFMQFEKVHANSINQISDLFGMVDSVPVTRGFYEWTFDSDKKELVFKRSSGEAGGVHEAFWNVFYIFIRNLSNRLIAPGTNSSSNNQQVSSKLAELANNLTYGSRTKGNWLSMIRNSVNYGHRLGTWFPYTDHRDYLNVLHSKKTSWLSDPMTIDLSSHGDKDLLRFQATCCFIVSLCRVLVWDMANRNSEKKSFHQFGSIALLNLMEPDKHRIKA
jgi:hypothetical protein